MHVVVGAWPWVVSCAWPCQVLRGSRSSSHGIVLAMRIMLALAGLSGGQDPTA